MILKACLETYAALDYRNVHPGTCAAVGISISQPAIKRWSNFPGLEWQGKEIKGNMKLRTVTKKEPPQVRVTSGQKLCINVTPYCKLLCSQTHCYRHPLE